MKRSGWFLAYSCVHGGKRHIALQNRYNTDNQALEGDAATGVVRDGFVEVMDVIEAW